ncbi:MAG: glycosyltransferase involved in cell wall biosynthesis [Pseudomonadales bacterium]|jgi:glycosyltransferase involved in cell wall biosynthesis
MNTPLLSIIVIVYDMPEQAWNTLLSLTPTYQRNVDQQQYEVIVVENRSKNCIPAERVRSLPDNFVYINREENGISPAKAINEGLKQCRGQSIGLLIDGARMLTPRVVEFALQGLRIKNAVVTVPGYYLTEFATLEKSSKEILRHEEKLLKSLDWMKKGYSLFKQACFSNGNRHGLFHPIMESNALFFSREAIETINGVDEKFSLKGGGSVNLHLYRLLTTATDAPIIVLQGEGNLHQFHGGTSTTKGQEREQLVVEFKKQLDSYWPNGFKSVTREPYLLGTISADALPLIEQSIIKGTERFNNFKNKNRDPWDDDAMLEVNHGER